MSQSATKPTHIPCPCGQYIPITIPRRSKGEFSPTCPNCSTPTGITIRYSRKGDLVEYELLHQDLAPAARRIDMNADVENLSLLESYFAARYPLLLIETQEPARTISSLEPICTRIKKRLVVWDVVAGIQPINDPQSKPNSGITSPAAVLDESIKQPEHSIIVLKNFHVFLKAIDIYQRIQNYVDIWKQRNQTIIALTPSAQLPAEVERLFTVIDDQLPNAVDIGRIIDRVMRDHHLPEPDNREHLVRAASGLTSYEIENALCLSLLRSKQLDPSIVTEEKRQLIRKHGGLELASFNENFSTLGGFNNAKRWILQRFKMHLQNPTLPFKGILMLGIPGTGKSHFAKALGNELKLPTLMMDFGRMFTGENGREGIVGSAEAMIRRCLQIADAMSPCILMLDEIDKGLSGVQSSGRSDGGTGSRVFGQFLTWLQDHKSEVFVVASANNISGIPPEFFRPGRWDGLFWVDTPEEDEQDRILEIYGQKYGVAIPPTLRDNMDLTGWTGAELQQLCVEAAYSEGDFDEAARNVIPLAHSAGEYLGQLRDWGEARCIPANKVKVAAKKSKPKASVPTPSGHYL